MKALMLSEYGNLQIMDISVPTCASDEVLIRVAACGICGSDVHGYQGASGRRIPPIVMGHEAAGIIERVGAEVKDYKPGDRVTFDSTVYCGKCEFCQRGEVNLCDHRQVLGVSCGDYRRDGAFAELVAVPARILYRLPDQFPFEEAAMLEAVSVALHGVRVTQMKGDESVLVIGAGMIGLLTAQAARSAGCNAVMIADVDAARLKIAKEVGIPDTLHLGGKELIHEVLRRTGGRGVDIVLEAVGRAETVVAAIECVRKGGTVTLIGNIEPEVPLPLQRVVTREVRLQGSCASAGEYEEAIRLMSHGAITVKPLISATSSLEQASDWFRRLHNRETGLLKVVVTPNA
ncbi:galactitol-1-phosphate 5-dehydrogenase [Silvibacterium dinghuense]|uniref:Galactitol-1-phosphate 5-dehydrogenase n=1 Tax=Silvibacterium dinghuense TaxID=1560006 RepID=A0A4Q1SDP7_9BACT|nr:galactitol-1-phosphate 5-dehydrogenase [Silvibacterium dinghuense]RXS95217.1 galactitol-1-phosphate 5-dehydrogenase [Silvibacterium dinghuense]GGH11599.1 galactitol-1-phosphate 5-dehydrogenase [Silvibacterium dinghuense]